MLADLHIHTYYSDGLDSPASIVEKANTNNLAAIAITDHDSIAGITEAITAARKLANFQIIPGIELSTTDNGQDIHVLGYFIDYNNHIFTDRLKELRQAKTIRNQLIVDKLNQLGIEITLEEINNKALTADSRIGRPHIAEVLYEKKLVKSIAEAFHKYLGDKGLAYIETKSISPEEGIDIIKQAGGAVVLAHPGIYNNETLLKRLINYGLDGVEVNHPDHNLQTINTLKNIAKKNSLIITGGSDYHGYRNNNPFHAKIGSFTVSTKQVNQLKLIADKRKRDL